MSLLSSEIWHDKVPHPSLYCAIKDTRYDNVIIIIIIAIISYVSHMSTPRKYMGGQECRYFSVMNVNRQHRLNLIKNYNYLRVEVERVVALPPKILTMKRLMNNTIHLIEISFSNTAHDR